MRIKKKYFVIILSYLIAAAVVLGGFVIQSRKEITQNQMQMSAPYRANFASLASSLNTIDLTLQKGAYATTPYQAMVLAANVWLEAGSAKVALEQLPTYDLTMANTEKYLNQVGEYAFYLAKKAVNGEEITEEEQKNLQQMGQTAGKLSEELQTLQAEIMNDGKGYDEIKQMLKRTAEDTENAVPAMTGQSAENKGSENPLEKLELSFNKDAQLTYDGLFSDHLINRASEYLKTLEEVPEEEAKNAAAQAMGKSPDEISKTGEVTGGGIDCFNFSDQENLWSVSVSKNGGLIKTLSCNRPVGELVLSDEEAVKKGEEFLKESGFSEFIPVFQTFDGNTLTIVFAHQQDDVVLYTEKISIGVALDNGDVVFADADEYLMNKLASRTFTRNLTQQQAAEKLSDRLTEQECRQAVIASDGNYEKLCYEFKTLSDDNKTILVYINAENGREEKIAILNNDDRGVYLS